MEILGGGWMERGANALAGLTHPADASLGDPLFAARKEGTRQFCLFFLPSFLPAKEREVQRRVDRVSPLEAALTQMHWR